MLGELLSQIRQGGKRETTQTNPAQDRVITSLLPLERRYALMCLLRATHTLDKGQVESLANELYQDALSKKIRSLHQSATAARLFTGKDYLREDPFLNHVALTYSQPEMEQPMLFKPLKVFGGAEQTLGLIDMLSGSGPSRPLLHDLYTLDGLGLAWSDEIQRFGLTFAGATFADTIDLRFQHVVEYEGRRGFMIVLGPKGATVQNA